MKQPLTLAAVLVVLLGACAARNGGDVGVTHITSASPNASADPSPSCLRNDLECEQNADCCSFWCVNGQCELREP